VGSGCILHDQSLFTPDVFEKSSFLCPLVHSTLFPLFFSFYSSHFLLAVEKDDSAHAVISS